MVESTTVAQKTLITLNKKASRENNLLIGQCSLCNKAIIVSDRTIQAES